jgi:hypothetical protein
MLSVSDLEPQTTAVAVDAYIASYFSGRLGLVRT